MGAAAREVVGGGGAVCRQVRMESQGGCAELVPLLLLLLLLPWVANTASALPVLLLPPLPPPQLLPMLCTARDPRLSARAPLTLASAGMPLSSSSSATLG